MCNNTESIKSTERVKAYGEVFTQSKEVNDMMNLPKLVAESYVIDSTWLEPSCGTGNFLVEIISRKLATAAKEPVGSEDYAKAVIRSFMATYGVDIQADNVNESQRRMYDIFLDEYMKHEGVEAPKWIKDAVAFILAKNIIFGNMLTFRMVEQDITSTRRFSCKTKTSIKGLANIPDDDISKSSVLTVWNWFIEDNRVYVQICQGPELEEVGNRFGGVTLRKINTLTLENMEEEENDLF